jgi:hypothetical protein
VFDPCNLARNIGFLFQISNIFIEEACKFDVKMHNLTAKMHRFGAKTHDFTAKMHSFGIKMHDFTAKMHGFGIKIHDFMAKMHNFFTIFQIYKFNNQLKIRIL